MTSFLCKLDPKNNFLEVLDLGFGSAGLQHKLLTLIESPNVFHWKSTKKVKCVWSVGQNLGQILYNVVRKQRKTGISVVFLIFSMRCS